MARAKLHLICGNCGCNDMWTYRIDSAGHDIDGKLSPAVFLVCGNCSTLHDLSDTATETLEKNKDNKLEGFMDGIRKQADAMLDSDESTIKDELDALEWQLSEIAQRLTDMETLGKTGREFAINRARKNVDTAVQRSYRAKQISDGLKVVKTR